MRVSEIGPAGWFSGRDVPEVLDEENAGGENHASATSMSNKQSNTAFESKAEPAGALAGTDWRRCRWRGPTDSLRGRASGSSLGGKRTRRLTARKRARGTEAI